MSRLIPNIIITGTPGCGKSSHSRELQKLLGENYKHIPVSDLAKEKDFIESYDEVLDTSVVDEDKLLDHLEIELEKGGRIIDWHVCDIFPERLIDLVVVLRCDNSILYDRLSSRGYKDNKIQENLDAEIMEVILQDATEGYAPELVVVLNSESDEEMKQNVERIGQWVDNWLNDHPEGVSNAKIAKTSEDSEASGDSEASDSENNEYTEEEDEDDYDDEEEEEEEDAEENEEVEESD